MSVAPFRPLVAPAMIALAACAGGYMVFTAPAQSELVELRRQIDAIQREAESARQFEGAGPKIAEALRAIEADAARIDAAGATARQERDVFAAIGALARAHGITINQLSPMKAAERASSTLAGPAAPGVGTPATPEDTRLGFAISIDGEYASVARFVRGLRAVAPFTLVRTVRLSPALGEGTGVVGGEIQVEFFAFDTAPPAAPVAAAPGDGPMAPGGARP